MYVQDTWKPKANLTIDAGLRWEMKMHPTNPDNLIRVPNQRVAVDAAPSNALSWVPGDLYKNDMNNLGPSIGAAWDPKGDAKSALRANYRIAYDRINTFLLSSAIFQSIPGLTTGVVNTSFGQAGGRLRDGLPALQPTVSPRDFLQPATSSNSARVVDPEFQSPITHGWAISYQHEVWSKTMLEMKLERRYGSGMGYLVGYTLSRSKDTRSYDPACTVVSTGNNQSASSTPFDVHDRSLNYALSDFDRTHVFQGQWVVELPFGRGHRFAGSAPAALDAIVAGWQVAGQVVIESGRPMTVYSGSNTFSNVVQTPANCDGCSRDLGARHQEGGIVFYITPEERAKFSNPDAGQYSNVGRNFFRSPMFSNLNVTVSKRTRIMRQQSLEIRLDATNVLNQASFGFPTLTMTSATFGRIFNGREQFAARAVGGEVPVLGTAPMTT